MGKGQHSGSMGVMATSGPADQARISGNKTSMRLNNKFDQNAGGASGANYGVLGSLSGLQDSHGSFEQVQP